MKQIIASPCSKISGQIQVPPDKSITHRAILLAGLSDGVTEIKNPLMSEDTQRTIQAVRTLGVSVDDSTPNSLFVKTSAFIPPTEAIDCGNSGTLMRIFAGIATGWNIPCQLIGDESLMRRPMERVILPLRNMGAIIESEPKGKPPITIKKRTTLKGILYHNKLSSAQVKSALLLAGIRAEGSTIIAEPLLSRNHTELMLPYFGVPIRYSEDGGIVEITGGQTLSSPEQIEIPSDLSSAMFFIVAATISPHSDVLLTNVGENPTRQGGLLILQQMGADIDIINRRQMGGEKIADIRIRGGDLHGIEIKPEMVPMAIDDIPILCIAAACARGKTTITGAGELRYKESDRLAAMYDGLSALGVNCQESPDGLEIVGRSSSKPAFSGGHIDSYGDHRIAMSFSIASLRSQGDITIDHCDNIQTSFPNFTRLATSAGMRIVESDIDKE